MSPLSEVSYDSNGTELYNNSNSATNDGDGDDGGDDDGEMLNVTAHEIIISDTITAHCVLYRSLLLATWRAKRRSIVNSFIGCSKCIIL